MRAIEVAHSMNLNNLWLESDSELVVHAFKNINFMVVWNIRNRWHNDKLLLSHMNCIVSHIYREGNQVADTLANYGCSLSSLTCWHYVPDFVKDSFVKNILGILSFRICNS
jgi:ribonuclease HI